MKHKGSCGSSPRNEEIQEEDVWAIVKDREGSSSTMSKGKDPSVSSSSRCFTCAPRRIPRTKSGGHDANIARQQLSAPVNIPDWSKIYKKNVRNGPWTHDNEDNNGVDGVHRSYYESVDGVVNQDDEEQEEEEIIPPHEYIARKLARSQIASFSMCEGIGRTLKGRDLSKLRNAILTKTGFLE